MDSGGAKVLTNGKKRMIAFLAAACLAVCAAASATAEIEPLAMDLTVHGQPLQEDGWNEERTVYQDESIRAELFKDVVKPASSAEKIQVWYAVVEIRDPSQLRTTLSNESFGDQAKAKAQAMAKIVNAVVAINDDQVKFNLYNGYVIRQGVFYQDTLEQLSKPQDVLIIDDQGDFSIVVKASTEKMNARFAEMEADGRKPVNVFTFGPALVIDGEGQECRTEDSIHNLHQNTSRTVIGQLGPLKYFMLVSHGENPKHTGFKGNEMVQYILEKFPECTFAYNLDGGNASKMAWLDKNNKYRLKSDSAGGRQEITGLIYFASAAVTEEQGE